MEEIDIKDRYELHNLLKKINTNEKISFGRMPDIYIDCANKQEFLIEQINLLSPILVDEFEEKEVFNLEIINKRHVLDEFEYLGFNDIFYVSLLQYTKGIKILKIVYNNIESEGGINEQEKLQSNDRRRI